MKRAVIGALVAITTTSAGCFLFEWNKIPGGGTGGGSGSGGHGTGAAGGHGGAGTGGGDGGLPPECRSDAGDNLVTDECGVFVQADAAGSSEDGTMAHPYKSLQMAIDKAGGKRVYACASAPFEEAVEIGVSVEIYGGFSCATESWVYDAMKKTQIALGADQIPLHITKATTNVEVYDFTISAAKANGGSSIAVLIAQATASFTRCDLAADDAKSGEPGMDGGDQKPSASAGVKGDSAGMSGTANGGKGGSNTMCGSPDGSGGDGGNGGQKQDGDGADGAQGDGNMGGAKGTGQTMTLPCTSGGPGTFGIAGSDGPGASGIGSIGATGYNGTDGQDGVDGTKGRSGGGGGGSMGLTSAHGAGGGGGGAGGCGGKGGGGGKAGGSSIALVSVGATVTMTSCTLKAGKGASGGAGGARQVRQVGGAAGLGGDAGGPSKGCNGGDGGDGGSGGNGGGGLGGHSLGIAAMGTAPVLDNETKGAIKIGAKGTGGSGGNQGTDGIAAPCLSFGTNVSCP